MSRRRVRVAPPLSARDTAELAGFAQLLNIEHARRSPDAVPWALDTLKDALYSDGLGGDDPPPPCARDQRTRRLGLRADEGVAMNAAAVIVTAG